MPQPTFGSHLESVRRAAGLGEKELATAIRVSQSTISRFIHDKLKPTVEQVDGLAKCCGVSRFALIGGTEFAAEFSAGCVVSRIGGAREMARVLRELSDDPQRGAADGSLP